MSIHDSDTAASASATPDLESGSKLEQDTYAIETKGEVEVDPYRVFLDKDDDPKHFVDWRKWVIICVISSAATCVACGSSMVRDSVWPNYRSGLTYY